MSGFVGSEHSLLRTLVKMERKVYATDKDVYCLINVSAIEWINFMYKIYKNTKKKISKFGQKNRYFIN